MGRAQKIEAHTARETIEDLANTRLCSEELGIQLFRNRDREMFEWFVASMLLGGCVSQAVATETWRAFRRRELLDPHEILRVGPEYLAENPMKEGGYVPRNGLRAPQIVQASLQLLYRYGGSLKAMHTRAADPRDLERRLAAFDGVGPLTVNVFLRELRPVWSKADPEPLPVVRLLAPALGIDLDAIPRRSIEFARVEAGLLRMKSSGALVPVVARRGKARPAASVRGRDTSPRR